MAAVPDQDAARLAVDRFVRRFGNESYRQLAQHAALPFVLTPQLLNYLGVQFLRNLTPRLPWVAEADLLLSDLCDEVGYEQYALKPPVRDYLLEEMRRQPGGERRMRQVARLLLSYLEGLARTSPCSLSPRDLETQQLAALVCLDDQRQAAARRIAERFREQVTAAGGNPRAEAELSRLVQLTQSLAPQLADFPELVRYAELCRDQLLGTGEGAGPQGEAPTQAAGVKLPPPRLRDRARDAAWVAGELLPADLRLGLVDALGRLPVTATQKGRTTLLAGLPPALVRGLPRSNAPRVDLSGILTYLDQVGRLEDTGEWPLLVVAKNAQATVPGTGLWRELRELARRLEEHYGREPASKADKQPIDQAYRTRVFKALGIPDEHLHNAPAFLESAIDVFLHQVARDFGYNDQSLSRLKPFFEKLRVWYVKPPKDYGSERAQSILNPIVKQVETAVLPKLGHSQDGEDKEDIEFEKVIRPEVVRSAHVFCWFPFFLTQARQSSWFVIPYAEHAVLGMCVRKDWHEYLKLPEGKDKRHIETEDAAFLVDRLLRCKNHTRDKEPFLFNFQGYAAGEILTQEVKKLAMNGAAGAQDLLDAFISGMEIVEYFPDSERSLQETIALRLRKSKCNVFLYDVADEERLFRDGRVGGLDVKLIRYEHHVHIPVGVGCSLYVLPLLLKAQSAEQMW